MAFPAKMVVVLVVFHLQAPCLKSQQELSDQELFKERTKFTLFPTDIDWAGKCALYEFIDRKCSINDFYIVEINNGKLDIECQVDSDCVVQVKTTHRWSYCRLDIFNLPQKNREKGFGYAGVDYRNDGLHGVHAVHEVTRPNGRWGGPSEFIGDIKKFECKIVLKNLSAYNFIDTKWSFVLSPKQSSDAMVVKDYIDCCMQVQGYFYVKTNLNGEEPPERPEITQEYWQNYGHRPLISIPELNVDNYQNTGLRRPCYECYFGGDKYYNRKVPASETAGSTGFRPASRSAILFLLWMKLL